MTGALAGRRVLIVEDSYLGAMELQRLVEELGGEVLGPVATLAKGQAIYREERPGCGIFDVNLDGSTSYPLVREMIEAGGNPVLSTGYDPSTIDPEFSDVPRITKPLNRREATGVLQAAFAGQ